MSEATPRPACLQFRMGNPHSPSSPWGRDELDVFADGRIAYRNQRGGLAKAASAQLTPAAAEQVFAAFAASPFPVSPDKQLLPGGSTCELIIGDVKMLFDYHTALKTPAYAPLVRTLTAWTGALRLPADQRTPMAELTDVVDA